MFFVADKPKHKREKILHYLDREPMIAVLLAAANFEWTVGRCILFFSVLPNIVVREELAKCHGLDGYKTTWKQLLVQEDSTIPVLANVIKLWKEFREAFELRHKLIHGRGTCSRNMAENPVGLMLAAAEDLYEFAFSIGKDLNDRVPVRRRGLNGTRTHQKP